jgi:hypothetical protein
MFIFAVVFNMVKSFGKVFNKGKFISVQFFILYGRIELKKKIKDPNKKSINDSNF